MKDIEPNLAFTSAGGTWEVRVLDLDFASVDQHMNLYFKGQIRAGISARREVTEDGICTYIVATPMYKVQGEIHFKLLKLGNEKTRIIAIGSDRLGETILYQLKQFESWLVPKRASGNSDNKELKESSFELSQEFIFNDDANAVCAYFLGREDWQNNNHHEIDITDGQFVMRAVLSAGPAIKALYVGCP